MYITVKKLTLQFKDEKEWQNVEKVIIRTKRALSSMC